MFYVYDLPRGENDQAIALRAAPGQNYDHALNVQDEALAVDGDIDFVDDALLNTAPHNVIEKQLLRGDVVGLALMSSAILWSAMGAFG